MKPESKLALFLFFLLFSSFCAFGSGYKVKEINLLALHGLRINGAGPLLIKYDTEGNQVILANTLTSSLSVLHCRTNMLENIPLGSRVPQYLKSEALAIDTKNGIACLIGDHCLLVARIGSGISFKIGTRDQYETIAIDSQKERAYLAGRSSKNIAVVDLRSKVLKKIKWVNKTEPIVNLNQTPPPPIRKVFWDPKEKHLIAIDGFTSTLYIVNNDNIIYRRKLKLSQGGRWHLAGFNVKTGRVYLVIETNKRKVIQAASISTRGKAEDLAVALPSLTEAVGINYSPSRDEVYIPYDNHPVVQVVDFKKGGTVTDVKVPAYGNDASALDESMDRLYVTSWAQGEIDVIDLVHRKLIKRIQNAGILPHMFNIAWNPMNRRLYIPLGATAVNGSFGAAITVLDPESKSVQKVYTGWCPVDVVPMEQEKGAVAFSSEDEWAFVDWQGNISARKLPCLYPVEAAKCPDGDIYLSYGPHQSYWPVVYIWPARDGILLMDHKDFSFYDRRIPRQAQRIVVDSKGTLFATQNNWGKEKQFITFLKDKVRLWDPSSSRITTGDEVIRETTQRVLKLDETSGFLYILRVGEKDSDPGILNIIDLSNKKVVQKLEVGLCPTDISFNRRKIFVTNYVSNSITVIDKKTFMRKDTKIKGDPLKIVSSPQGIFFITHRDSAIYRLNSVNLKTKRHKIPYKGLADNLVWNNGRCWVSMHNAETFHLLTFDPANGKFKDVIHFNYPYGETAFDTKNTSFYLNGQFGDAIYEITRIRPDRCGHVWVSDFLSGRLFIVSMNK